jgi:hypothetical protein
VAWFRNPRGAAVHHSGIWKQSLEVTHSIASPGAACAFGLVGLVEQQQAFKCRGPFGRNGRAVPRALSGFVVAPARTLFLDAFALLRRIIRTAPLQELLETAAAPARARCEARVCHKEDAVFEAHHPVGQLVERHDGEINKPDITKVALCVQF